MRLNSGNGASRTNILETDEHKPSPTLDSRSQTISPEKKSMPVKLVGKHPTAFEKFMQTPPK